MGRGNQLDVRIYMFIEKNQKNEAKLKFSFDPHLRSHLTWIGVITEKRLKEPHRTTFYNFERSIINLCKVPGFTTHNFGVTFLTVETCLISVLTTWTSVTLYVDLAG